VTHDLATATVNPFRDYSPRGACAEVLVSALPEVLISGPAGTGKSRSCLEKLNYCASNYPASRYLIVRKTRSSLSDTGLVTFERDVLGLGNPMLIDGPQRPWRRSYRYANGSEIVVGGLDKPGKVLSAEYDVVFVQQAEEVNENDWETLTTRLRNNRLPFQQLLADCNPAAPTHWLKRRCDAGRTELLQSRHEDNPLLWMDNGWTDEGRRYIATLDALTGARRDRLRFGRWVQAEGVVYEGWNPALHLIDRFEIPDDWERFRCIDFGYVHAFVCGWWAVDHDGRMYLYRQLYMTGRTVKAHAEQIKQLSKGERIRATVCDHDAENMAQLREAGIPTRPANKAVALGIQKVQERLKVQGDGKPRLFVMRGSLVEVDRALERAKKPFAVEQEFDGYVWQNKAHKEEPVKADDHGMDMVRYAVMYQDSGKGVFFA
jgi:phage terminase large subunit